MKTAMNNTVNTRPSIALFAYSQPGAACLKELIQIGANVSVVFTHIDSENEAIWFDSVYDLAKENNIPVYRSKKIDESAFAFFRQAFGLMQGDAGQAAAQFGLHSQYAAVGLNLGQGDLADLLQQAEPVFYLREAGGQIGQQA